MTPSRSQEGVFPNDTKQGSGTHSFQSVSTRKILLFWQVESRFLGALESSTTHTPCQSRHVRGCQAYLCRYVVALRGLAGPEPRRVRSSRYALRSVARSHIPSKLFVLQSSRLRRRRRLRILACVFIKRDHATPLATRARAWIHRISRFFQNEIFTTILNVPVFRQ